jgi:hypothetical protein
MPGQSREHINNDRNSNSITSSTDKDDFRTPEELATTWATPHAGSHLAQRVTQKQTHGGREGGGKARQKNNMKKNR